MNPEMPKDLQKWSVTRQQGKARFVLVTGVLSWGVPMFALMTFVVNRRPDRPLTPLLITLSALVWLLGGACFGLAMWAITERRYRKFLGQNPPPG